MVAWSKPSCLVTDHELLQLVVSFGQYLYSGQSNGPEVSRSEFWVETGTVYEHVSIDALTFLQVEIKNERRI